MTHPAVEYIDRWKVKYKQGLFKGYIVDRRIFITLAIIILALAAYAFGKYGTEERIYINCPDTVHGMCLNPCFNVTRCGEYAAIEYLSPGETFGTKPDWFYSNYPTMIIFLCALAVVLNHFIYNRKFEGGELDGD